MASNFDFLEEWPKLQAATKRAESHVHNDPETSDWASRKALELTVRRVYKYSSLRIPEKDRPTLGDYLHEETFKEKLPATVFKKLVGVILPIGNSATHDEKVTKVNEALKSLRALFDFMRWFHAHHSPNLVFTPPRFREWFSTITPKRSEDESKLINF